MRNYLNLKVICIILTSLLILTGSVLASAKTYEYEEANIKVWLPEEDWTINDEEKNILTGKNKEESILYLLQILEKDADVEKATEELGKEIEKYFKDFEQTEKTEEKLNGMKTVSIIGKAKLKEKDVILAVSLIYTGETYCILMLSLNADIYKDKKDLIEKLISKIEPIDKEKLEKEDTTTGREKDPNKVYKKTPSCQPEYIDYYHFRPGKYRNYGY